MKYLLAAPLFFALVAASAPQPSVVTATTDWSFLPPLKQYGYDHLTKNLLNKLIEIAEKRQCALPGYNGEKLDFDISFAARFDPDGSLQQVVIPNLNCPQAEGLVGGALIEMIQGRDYRPTGANPGGWYQGQFTFAYGDPF